MTTHPSRLRRLRRPPTTIAVVAMLALAGCGDASTDPTTEPTVPDSTTPSPTLDGRAFLSTGTAGFDLVPDTTVRLEFHDGSLSASAGCNILGGPYRLDGDVLLIDALSTTEMGCEQPLMDQDARLAEFLGSGPTLSLDGDTLTLAVTSGTSDTSDTSGTSGDASITFLDREVADPDRPLEGTTWTLDTIVTGEAAASVPTGVTATLTIVDGRARVQAGCNAGSAAVTVGDGTIEFGPMALTKMACAAEAMDVERAVTSVLAGATGFEIEAGRLTITAATPSTTTSGLSFTAGS